MDSMENPLDVALENLPKLLVRYSLNQKRIRKIKEEKNEDSIRVMNGQSPIFRDPSSNIIQDLIDASTFVNIGCDEALKQKKVVPIIKTYEAYTNYKKEVKKEVEISVNQKLLKMQGSESKVVEKMGKFFSNVSKFIY